jgi:hypothetical protein
MLSKIALTALIALSSTLLANGPNAPERQEKEEIQEEKKVVPISKAIQGNWKIDIDAMMKQYDEKKDNRLPPEARAQFLKIFEQMKVEITAETISFNSPQSPHKVNYQIVNETEEKLTVDVKGKGFDPDGQKWTFIIDGEKIKISARGETTTLIRAK